MKKKHLAALLMMGVALPAMSAERPPNYIGLLGNYVFPDSVRNDDDGPGATLLLGLSLTPELSAEVSLFGHRLEQEVSKQNENFYGGGIDLRYLFGSQQLGGFLIGGVGAVREDFVGDSENSPYANLGAGLLVGITRSLQFRGEVRQFATFNKASYPGENTQYDTRLGVGFQYAFAGAPVFVDGDSDGDGVADSIDQCPGTPPGTLVDAVGCPIAVPVPDSDSDGVPDDVDQCPNTPLGTAVDAVGCPLDEDGDGVPNALDQCPGTPPGFQVDARGCVVEKQTVAVLRNVSFEFDSAKLTEESRRILDRVATGLRGQPSMTVEIAGHTDSLGTEAYNQKLSLARATSVRDFLVGVGSISGSRLQVQGYGESSPVATNETDAGRAENRRVEFRVLTR